MATMPERYEVEVTFRVEADSADDAKNRVLEHIDGRLDFFGLIVAEGEQ